MISPLTICWENGETPEQVQQVGDDGDDRGPDERAADAPLAPEQARPADHDDRDRVELEAVPWLGSPAVRRDTMISAVTAAHRPLMT